MQNRPTVMVRATSVQRPFGAPCRWVCFWSHAEASYATEKQSATRQYLLHIVAHRQGLGCWL